MTDIRIDQALFGYADGHRLFGSSLDLDQAGARLLRSATDMSFGRSVAWYSTMLPLPTMNRYAFARSWPAREWTRPGSVWAHVLLIEADQLGELAELRPLAELFREPKPADRTIKSASEGYSRQLRIPNSTARERPVDRSVATTVLAQLYSTNDPITVVDSNASLHEQLLFRIMEQQWPELRVSFAGRTRARSSDASWRVDLDIVEKDIRTHGETEATADWVSRLASDLESPDPVFRHFLRVNGVGDDRSRTRMRDLASISVSIDNRRASDLVNQLRAMAPLPTDMQHLKLELLGSARASVAQPWPSEMERIRMVFELGRGVDFSDLNVGERLLALARQPDHRGLHELDFDRVDAKQLRGLVADIAERADLSQVLQFVEAAPDLGVLVASRRPEVLESEQVWGALDYALALEVYGKLKPKARDNIADSLVASEAVLPVALICERDQSAWWRIVSAAAAKSSSVEELLKIARVMRSVLDRVGAASVEGEGDPRLSPQQLTGVLLAAPLAAGLWRRRPFEDWLSVRTAVREGKTFGKLPDYALDRILTATLVSALSIGLPAPRSAAWTSVFTELHRRLEDPRFDGEAWEVLSNTLPTGEEWDRCLRLRRGLAAEIRRDRWSPSQVDLLLADSGPVGPEVRRIIADAEPKRRQTIFELIGHFFS